MDKQRLNKIENKIKMISKRLYNSALIKAENKELTAAVELLEKSVQYDKKNIEARNLLGLIYYQIGDIGQALEQWIISSNMDNTDNNFAKGYIDDVRKEQRTLDNYAKSVHLYNDALNKVQQNSEDLAIIILKKSIRYNNRFVKALNLLALCYIKLHQDAKAMKLLEDVLKIDNGNPKALKYHSNIILNQRNISKEELVNTTITNDEAKNDIKRKLPIHKKKETNWFAPLTQILLFVIGIVCGVAVVLTLYIPDKINKLENENDEIKKSYSQQIDVLEKSNNSYETELKKLKEENTKLTNDNKNNKDIVDKYNNGKLDSDILVKSVNNYFSGNKIQSAVDILEIDQSKLNESNKKLYDTLKNATFTLAANRYNNDAYALYSQAQRTSDEQKFKDALSKYEIAYKLYDNRARKGDMLYFIARCYQFLDQKDIAKEKFEQLLNEYKDDVTRSRLNQAKSQYNIL